MLDANRRHARKHEEDNPQATDFIEYLQCSSSRPAPRLTDGDDLIIRGGSPHFAVEVERILTAHPAVRDAAVASRDVPA
jgi:acyl-CoA synthetase (AMP-forming)/AMP-acid ligase II